MFYTREIKKEEINYLVDIARLQQEVCFTEINTFYTDEELLKSYYIEEVLKGNDLGLDIQSWLDEMSLGTYDIIPVFNIEKLDDISYWVNVVYGEIEPPALSNEEKKFINSIIDCLPVDFNQNVMKIWAEAIFNATGKKGRDLYHPIRLAITGIEFGPELSQLLPLMKRDKVIERLKNIK